MKNILKHDEVRLADIGTLIEPHLYCITSGSRNNKGPDQTIPNFNETVYTQL